MIIWIIAIFALGVRFWHGQFEFSNRKDFKTDQIRPTGGHGHVQIDFAGQWLMGRMIATGNGKHLFDRNVQWNVVRAGLPRSDEPPYLRDTAFPTDSFAGKGPDDQTDHDAESLMTWLMGKDPPEWQHVGEAVALCLGSPHPLGAIATLPITQQHLTPDDVQLLNQPSIGGPLYPPILGVLYSPLGLFEKPHQAYFVLQVALVLAVVIAGKGVTYLSHGRIWWPVAIFVLLLFPGCRSAIDLAQNPSFSVCILIWGWALMSRGREWTGGAVLGLLAFKPVWAIMFFISPCVLGRWRMAAAMAVVGLLQIAVTIPIVGVQSWKDWLVVGKEASECYSVNQNWIELSRDFGGIVRRPLIDMKKPEAERVNPTVDRIAAAVVLTVFSLTIIVTLLCGDRQAIGLSAGFLLLGSFLSCYRFMYYDSMIAAAGFAALFATGNWLKYESRDSIRYWFRPFLTMAFVVLFTLILVENVITTWGIKGRITIDILGEPNKPKALEWEIGFRNAWDTLIILFLWAWLGVKLIFNRLAKLLFAAQS